MATPQQVSAAILAVVSRANIASDEAKLGFGKASDPPVVNPVINGSTIPGSFPRGAGLGQDAGKSKAIQALVEGLTDYVVSVSIPPKGAVLAYLTPGDISSKFDVTGLGLAGDYYGWAICNGNNGTPNRPNYFEFTILMKV
jgi:hypothetical protein